MLRRHAPVSRGRGAGRCRGEDPRLHRLPVVDSPTRGPAPTDEYLDKGLRLHDEYRDDPLISTMLAPYAPGPCGDETLCRVRALADELELPVTMQVIEERSLGSARPRTRCSPGSNGSGCCHPLLTAVHMRPELDDGRGSNSAAVSASASCIVAQSNLKLGNGECPVATLKAHDVNVALGTDGAASNNDLSMLDEMRAAACSLTARGLSPTLSPIPAHEWLYAATLNGARALGLAEVIGSLVAGKWADLCCIDLARAAHAAGLRSRGADPVRSVARPSDATSGSRGAAWSRTAA